MIMEDFFNLNDKRDVLYQYLYQLNEEKENELLKKNIPKYNQLKLFHGELKQYNYNTKDINQKFLNKINNNKDLTHLINALAERLSKIKQLLEEDVIIDEDKIKKLIDETDFSFLKKSDKENLLQQIQKELIELSIGGSYIVNDKLIKLQYLINKYFDDYSLNQSIQYLYKIKIIFEIYLKEKNKIKYEKEKVDREKGEKEKTEREKTERGKIERENEIYREEFVYLEDDIFKRFLRNVITNKRLPEICPIRKIDEDYEYINLEQEDMREILINYINYLPKDYSKQFIIELYERRLCGEEGLLKTRTNIQETIIINDPLIFNKDKKLIYKKKGDKDFKWDEYGECKEDNYILTEYKIKNDTKYILTQYNIEMNNKFKGEYIEYKFMDKEFEIIGFGLKSGNVEGGHWISLVKYNDGWYLTDDSIITKKENLINELREIERVGFKVIYILYKRKDVRLNNEIPFGLENRGNTCWFNSGLQLLLATNIRDYINDDLRYKYLKYKLKYHQLKKFINQN